LNFLVATNKESDVSVDWDFLECIYQNRNAVPTKVPEEERKSFKFDSSKYHDAVIMPWYRSQDQPQVCARAFVCMQNNI
jgi:endoribonuclease Dicer